MFIYFISALCLILSGLAITVAGGYLSVIGITMFIPDPHIYNVLILLAIALEIAKITASTFLFHEAHDKSFPLIFKGILFFLILALIVLSAITTFSHLNSSANKNLTSTKFYYVQLESLKKDKERITYASNNIDNRIKEIPADLDPKKRVVQIEKLEKERNSKEEELAKINEKISSVSEKINSSDDFAFLNSLSEILGYDRQIIFTYGVIFIVILIDPLAISLILAGTFLFNKVLTKIDENRKFRREEEKTIKENQKDILLHEEKIIEQETKIEKIIEEIKNEQLHKEEAPVTVAQPVMNETEDFPRHIESDDEGNIYTKRKKKKNNKPDPVVTDTIQEENKTPTDKKEESKEIPTPAAEEVTVNEVVTEPPKEKEPESNDEKNNLANILNNSIEKEMKEKYNELYPELVPVEKEISIEDAPLVVDEKPSSLPKKKILLNETFDSSRLKKQEALSDSTKV